MGDKNNFDLGDTIVHRTVGKVVSLTIISPVGNVDLSQDPDGVLVDGKIQPIVYLPHSDERDSILGNPRQFPQTEDDLTLIAEIVRSIREKTEH